MTDGIEQITKQLGVVQISKKCGGGANTNRHGKKFEEKANNKSKLIFDGYVENPLKTGFFNKKFEDKTITFTLQRGFKLFMQKNYNKTLFRYPDEAYIIHYNNGKIILKILEKKSQNVNGSVETKLWSGPSLKREYELVLGAEFEVHYAFCVNEFLKKKLTSNDIKYTTLNTILKENKIIVLFGDDENYFETLKSWINNSL